MDRTLPTELKWKEELCVLRAGKAGCNTGLATLLVHDPINEVELPFLRELKVGSHVVPGGVKTPSGSPPRAPDWAGPRTRWRGGE